MHQREPGFSITWIGHSTFLITIDGITILTDPIFGDASWLFSRINRRVFLLGIFKP